MRHTFHIPVMGTGFTIDTPLKVARYGITSVLSLVDDELIEQVRKHHAERLGEPFEPIAKGDADVRARRVTAYLDLLDRQVKAQVERMKAEPFDGKSDLDRYFRLLPDGELRTKHAELLGASDAVRRGALERELRAAVVSGAIEVNIMTKIDRAADARGAARPSNDTDALSALRGFAQSTLDSSIVFSAGMNARLYTYAAAFDDFFPDARGKLPKRIVLKVSDFRSADVQGRMLAKRGLWISEYRIESGLNCGGHAFASDGGLLGSILADFRTRKASLVEELFRTWQKTLRELGKNVPDVPPPVRVTVQGGIGTADEDRLLREHYGVDGTGWGTPFLLVPEATTLDEGTRRALAEAKVGDVKLSDSSPLGVPFWNLMTSASENARRLRVATGKPGSPCVKGYLAAVPDTDGPPQCLASRAYQRRKLEEPGVDLAAATVKSCICHDLGGGVTLSLGIDDKATPAVCPGPNIVNFGRVMTLDEMIDHIYGRANVLGNADRMHMFIAELELNVEYFESMQQREARGVEKMRASLVDSIEHYAREIAPLVQERARFCWDLARLRARVEHGPSPIEEAQCS